MNMIPQKNYFQRILLPLIVASLFIIAFLLIGVYAANLRSTLPDPFSPYDPASFGIPEIVAGYRIVAVSTLENTACMPAGEIRVTIQAVEPSADNPMVPLDGGDIIFELKKLNPNIHWGLSYIMPVPYDRQQHVTSRQQWNETMKNGCLKLGGPIDTDSMIPRFTPTPLT